MITLIRTSICYNLGLSSYKSNQLSYYKDLDCLVSGLLFKERDSEQFQCEQLMKFIIESRLLQLQNKCQCHIGPDGQNHVWTLNYCSTDAMFLL